MPLTALLAVLSIFSAPLVARAAAPPIPAPNLEVVGGTPIVQQLDENAPLAGVALIVRAGLDRQTMKQNGLAALVAQTIVRTPVAQGEMMMPLEDAVAARGGSVTITIDPDDVRFYIESLPDDAPAVVDMLRHALAAPDFSAATVRDAREALGRQIRASQQVALQVGLEMLNAASSTQANTGLPELGTPASLAQLFPSDVESFYRAFYRRGGALVSAAGRIDTLPQGALTNLAGALALGSTAPVAVQVRPLHGTTRELVAHRDIASPWLIAQYPAPRVDSSDFGPMLVLAAFIRRTISDIAQVPGVVSPTFASRSVGAIYVYDREPPSLVLYVNGGLIGDPSRAFATALSIVNVLAASPLEGSIDEFKAVAAGDFADDATTLETRTWLAAVFSKESSSPDFINRALAAISATTPADLARVAHKYLGNPTIALVLPRGQNLQD